MKKLPPLLWRLGAAAAAFQVGTAPTAMVAADDNSFTTIEKALDSNSVEQRRAALSLLADIRLDRDSGTTGVDPMILEKERKAARRLRE